MKTVLISFIVTIIIMLGVRVWQDHKYARAEKWREEHLAKAQRESESILNHSRLRDLETINHGPLDYYYRYDSCDGASPCNSLTVTPDSAYIIEGDTMMVIKMLHKLYTEAYKKIKR